VPDARSTRRQILRGVFNHAIYCLTGEAYSKGRSNTEVVARMLAAGIGIVQYREKEKSMRAKLAECRQLRSMTTEAGALFIVNDDVALAMAVDADGIHVGQDDMPVAETRKLVGADMLIGLSTHSPEQAREAVRAGADYIGVGPIFRTHTKKDVCAPVGCDYLDYVVRHIDLPFVAIGGIKEHHVADLVARGATCVAMVTEIVGSDHIEEKIQNIQNLIHSPHP
jgi:thiamine-phosphate pyrophosphorylase